MADIQLTEAQQAFLMEQGTAAAGEAFGEGGRARREGRRSQRQGRRAARQARRGERRGTRRERRAARRAARGGQAQLPALPTVGAGVSQAAVTQGLRDPSLFKVGAGTQIGSAVTNGNAVNGNGNGNGAAAWWMDPKILLLGAGAAWLLWRKK